MARQGADVEQATRNVQVVRSTYDALNRRDIDGLLALLHEDFELCDHGTGSKHQGHKQYREWIEEYFKSWEYYRETPEDLTPVDNRVLARVRSKGRGLRSGGVIEDQHGEIHTLDEGRIVSIAIYPTWGLAVKAAGFEDPAALPTDRSAERRGGRFRRPWRARP